MILRPWPCRACVIVGGWLFSLLDVTSALGQQVPLSFSGVHANLAPQQPIATRGCEELFRAPGVVWRGRVGTMTLQQLASYVAPVFWLSPDEPTLQQRSGRDIRIPAAMPFEPAANAPVVYYQVTMVDELPGAKASGAQIDQSNKGQSTLNFDVVNGASHQVHRLFSRGIRGWPAPPRCGAHRVSRGRRPRRWQLWRETRDTSVTPRTT